MKLRQLALTLHRFTGIMTGLLLAIIGLTGSMLVFKQEINHLLHPQMMQVVPQGERVSLQSVVATVKAAYPDEIVRWISVPEMPTQTYEIQTKVNNQSRSVYVNPYTGSILGSLFTSHSLMGFLLNLHYRLLAGNVGEIVVGLCGILLLLLGVTGIILWT